MAQKATKDNLKKKKAPTRSVTLVLDPDVAEAWAEAESKLDAARSDLEQGFSAERQNAVDRAEEELEALRPEYDEAAVELVVKGIGRPAWNALADEYSPTDKQRREARKLYGPMADQRYNPDTFPLALLAASLVEPEMTVEELNELFDSDGYNDAERNMLIAAAMEVNQTSRVMSLGKGSQKTAT